MKTTKSKKPTTASTSEESKVTASPSTKKKSWERPGLKGKKELSMLERIALIGAKNVLDTDEVILYTGLTRATIYQLTTKGKIPYYKAEHNSHLEGAKNYFKKAEIDSWLTASPRGLGAEEEGQEEEE